MHTIRSLKQIVYDAIYSDVVEGIYEINSILTEGLLMDKYGVSKSPVREALIELCKDNVLRSLPRIGYQIIPVSLQEVVDLVDFRVDLEISNLYRAEEYVTDCSINDLRSKLAPQNSTQGHGILRHWTENQQFHLALCALGQNGYTYRILEETLRQSARFAAQYFHIAWSRASESQSSYHYAIVEALSKKDIACACEQLRLDILSVKHELQRYLRVE